MNAHQILPKVLHKRTLGLSAMSTTDLEAYFKDCLFKDWEELGEEIRLKVFVLGGCRHKLVCAPAPCNFFTSAEFMDYKDDDDKDYKDDDDKDYKDDDDK